MAMACPCGRARTYADCCGAIHAGAAATTAEALMRSRYSAYVVGDMAYLRHSWAPETCPAELSHDPTVRWTGLTVTDTEGGGALAATGIVEFTAEYEGPAGSGQRTERSTFRRESGRWVYVDAEA